MANLLINNIGIFNNHIKGSNDLFRQFMGFYWDIFDNEKLYPNSLPLTVMNIHSSIKYGLSTPIDRTGLKFKQEVKLIFSGDLSLKTFLDQEYTSGLIARRINIFGEGPVGPPDDEQNVVRPINYTPSQGSNNKITNREALINFFKEEREIEDFNFSFRKTVPRSKDVDLYYSSIESIYQYYVQNYEEISTKIPEELLPNYYIFSLAGNSELLKNTSQKDYNSSLLSGQNSPYTNFLSKFDKLITLDGNLLFTTSFSLSNLDSYLKQYSEVYDNVSVDFVQTYKQKFGNFLTAFDSQEIFDRINSNKQYFPMFANIVFYKERTNSFFDLLKKSNISLSSLQSFILDKVLSKTVGDDSFLQTFFETDEKIFSSGGSLEFFTKNHFLMNFDRWFREYIESLNDNNNDGRGLGLRDDIVGRGLGLRDDNEGRIGLVPKSINIRDRISNSAVDIKYVSLGNNKIQIKPGKNVNRPPLDVILDDILINSVDQKYKEIVLNNFRTYKDIISGKFSNNEILFFRIEKADKKTGSIIQNFYLPNIPNINVMNYIDTQVKYNKLYSYKIYSVHIVYGTKYKYVLKESQDELLIPPGSQVSVQQQPDRQTLDDLGINNANSIDRKFFVRPNLTENIIKPQDYTTDLLPVTPQQRIDDGAILIPISDDDVEQDIPLSGDSLDFEEDFEPPKGKFAKKMNISPQRDESDGWIGGKRFEPNIDDESANKVHDGSQNPHRFLDFTKEGSIIFDVIFWPTIKLVEAEYSQEMTTKVVDYPPTLPDVSFFPLMESTGSFNIAIQDSSYEYEDYFIPILEEDLIFSMNFIHGGLIGPDGRLNFLDFKNSKTKFRGDGDTKEFQVFRTDIEPRSYRDFKLYKTLKYPDESVFLETIDSNKKYYYTFRTKDIHNNVSNPTPIYCAEIYNDQLLFIPAFSVFEFKKPQDFDWSKCAKKYIKIAPNIIHKIYDEQNERLGLGAKNIYDKQFLMRVRSKHTGRIIDIYLKFKLDKNINN